MGRLHNHAVLLEEQYPESYMPYMTIGWKIFQCLFGAEQKYKIARDGQSDADCSAGIGVVVTGSCKLPREEIVVVASKLQEGIW